MAALKGLKDMLPNFQNVLQLGMDKEKAFETIKEAYEKQKKSNTLGKDASLKTSKYNSILKMREEDEKRRMREIMNLQKNMQNMMSNFKI